MMRRFALYCSQQHRLCHPRYEGGVYQATLVGSVGAPHADDDHTPTVNKADHRRRRADGALDGVNTDIGGVCAQRASCDNLCGGHAAEQPSMTAHCLTEEPQKPPANGCLHKSWCMAARTHRLLSYILWLNHPTGADHRSPRLPIYAHVGVVIFMHRRAEVRPAGLLSWLAAQQALRPALCPGWRTRSIDSSPGPDRVRGVVM